MAKYIELETALSIRKPPKSNRQYQTDNLDDAYEQGWDDALCCLEHIPTVADVAPAMHGKWTPGIKECPVCGENKFKDLDADIWADWQPPFCPNCGARLDQDWA